MAYAVALSKPLPFVGSLSSKYGGYAGLSVATVSWPAVCVSILSGVQSDAATAVVEEPPELEPQPATTPASAAAAAITARDLGSGRLITWDGRRDPKRPA